MCFVLPVVRPNQQLRACCLPAALPAATASAVLECSHAGPLFTLTEVQLVFTDRESNGPHIEEPLPVFVHTMMIIVVLYLQYGENKSQMSDMSRFLFLPRW